jgi:hypothetical protein
MINPNTLTPSYWKQKSSRGKVYFACFKNIHGNIAFMSRRYQLKATDALKRAGELHARWKMEYDRSILFAVKSAETLQGTQK